MLTFSLLKKTCSESWYEQDVLATLENMDFSIDVFRSFQTFQKQLNRSDEKEKYMQIYICVGA